MNPLPILGVDRDELLATIRLALPMVFVQVGLMSMGVVDTLMVGHVSAQVLAAVALGNIYFVNVIVLSQGTLMARIKSAMKNTAPLRTPTRSRSRPS